MPWHKKNSATPPPQAQAPSAPAAVDNPPPGAEPKPVPPPSEPAAVEPAPPPPPVAETKPAEPVKRRKTKPSPSTPMPADAASTPATAGQPGAAANPSTTASATPPPTESAIGQLSAGDESSSGATKDEAVNLIASTERRLKAITRPLSPAEQQTANKVRTFLEQARQALHSQDIAAAHTLAIKANLLLDELQK